MSSMAGPARNLDFGDTPTRDAPAGHAALDATNAEHNSPLHLLARSGNVEGVGLLLQHGADPNLRGAGGCSPLHAVCDAPSTARTSSTLRAAPLARARTAT
ncbi:hypothetical protein JL722_13250 [Aureococcus anophagefferens]|nr:hypothetical protein JL722_13250 [Aureococcus anophagefferens]